MRSRRDRVRLSKTIAHALRHAPWQYGLTLDEAGWAPVADLLAALRRLRPEWRDLTERDLEAIIAHSDKQRFELRDGRIRALYGHSLPKRIHKAPAEPPEVLYHGTSPEAAARILKEGLKPMGRQYVHLSTTPAAAYQVGRRKAKRPVILRVRAREAYQAGIRFYRGSADVWLADFVPAAFIEPDEGGE